MRRLLVLIVAAILLSLTGCNKFKDIKVKSVKVEKVTPMGIRGVKANVAVEIDNPAPQVKLSEMEAVVKYSGKKLGKLTVDPFTMEGKTVKKYHLKAKMTLDSGVSFYDMLMFLDRDFKENCVVDVTVKGTLKGGLSKTIHKNDIPLKTLIK